MADGALIKPLKGILKHKHAPESHTPKDDAKTAKWDEMNIMATLHPSDKDYGLMKIDEPKTPYNWSDSEKEMGETETDGVNASDLAKRLAEGTDVPPRAMNSGSSSEDEREDETPEAKAERERFEKKRKLHYGGMPMAKLLRQAFLEDNEDEEDEDEGEGRLLEEGEASPANDEPDDNEAGPPPEETAGEDEAPATKQKQVLTSAV